MSVCLTVVEWHSHSELYSRTEPVCTAESNILPPASQLVSLSLLTQSAFEPPDRNVNWRDIWLTVTSVASSGVNTVTGQTILSHGCQPVPSCVWRPPTSPSACLDQSNQCRSVSSHDKGKCQSVMFVTTAGTVQQVSIIFSCYNCSNANNFLNTKCVFIW